MFYINTIEIFDGFIQAFTGLDQQMIIAKENA